MKPKACTARELKKVGVTIEDQERLRLRCDRCGERWQPMLRPGGKLPSRYWQCPNGCNAAGPKGN